MNRNGKLDPAEFARGLGVAALAACALAVQLGPYLHVELVDRDEAYYRSFAIIAARGGQLYADFWDGHFPALYHLYALVLNHVGDMTTLRLIAIGTIWIGAILFYLLLRRATGREAALLGMTSFALIVTSVGLEGRGVNTEHFIQTCVLGAVLVSFRNSSRRLFVAGALIGVATLFKQQAILYVAVPAVMSWRDLHRGIPNTEPLGEGGSITVRVAPSTRPARPFAAHLAVLVAGAATPILLALLWAAREGVLGSMLECTVVGMFYERLSGIGLLERADAASTLFMGIFHASPTIVLGILLGLTLLWNNRRISPTTPAHVRSTVDGEDAPYTAEVEYDVLPDLAWFGAGCLGIALAGRPFLHYAILLVPPAIRMTLVASDWTRARRPVTRPIGMALLAFVAIDAGLCALYSIELQVLNRSLGTEMRDETAVAQYLESQVPSEGSIFVWGPQPAIYLLADRAPATRFVVQGTLLTETPIAAALVHEMTESLRRQPPSYFIVAPAPPRFALARPGLESVQALLESEFELDRTIRGYDLFRPRLSGRAPTLPSAPDPR